MPTTSLILWVWNTRKTALYIQIVREFIDISVGHGHRTGRSKWLYMANIGVGIDALARECVWIETVIIECVVSGWYICLPTMA